MADSFTETTTKSWFDRLKDSIKSILLGIVLFVAAFPVLWWNEGRAVQTANRLEEGAAAVVSVSTDQVDSANEGKLVHATGLATTEEVLTDAEFGVSENAIKLIRHVEMFQWYQEEHEETERQTGGSEKTTTTYTYDTDWYDHAIDSSEFKDPVDHQNPGSMPFSFSTVTAKTVTIGAFKLSSSQIGELNEAEPVAMDAQRLEQTPETIRAQLEIRNGAFYRSISGAASPAEAPAPATPPSANEESESASTDGEGDGGDAGSSGEDGESAAEGEAGDEPPAEPAAPATGSGGPPEVGDVRISFSAVKPMTVSLIAQQSGDSFRPYETEAGGALDMLEPGDHSAEEMFEAAVAANNRWTWILRLVGFLLMAGGVAMVFGPLAVVADVLPILGDLARGGIFILAIAIALPLSLLTIAVAWLAYRPALGIGLILAAVVAGIGIYMIFRKKRPGK